MLDRVDGNQGAVFVTGQLPGLVRHLGGDKAGVGGEESDGDGGVQRDGLGQRGKVDKIPVMQ